MDTGGSSGGPPPKRRAGSADDTAEAVAARREVAAARAAGLELTEVEARVFAVLQAAKAHRGLRTTVHPSPGAATAACFALQRGPGERTAGGVQVRCAGGWVRDKVLGLASDDLDIAVDDMSAHLRRTAPRVAPSS
jgi:hypothetical protein